MVVGPERFGRSTDRCPMLPHYEPVALTRLSYGPDSRDDFNLPLINLLKRRSEVFPDGPELGRKSSVMFPWPIERSS